MRPTDLAKLRIPTSPSVSPDGTTVCYQLARIDLEANAYKSQIVLAPTDGSSPPRAYTHGNRDLDPRFSPDGRWIAFLRADADGRLQLHVLPFDGGEPRKVSDDPLGVGEHVWSPDSRHIAYVARVPEAGRYGTDPLVPPAKEPPRRITTLTYRADGTGWTIDRREHVFVVDALAEVPEPLRLTAGDFDNTAPCWHPDGSHVAFVSARHAERDRDFVTDVFVVPSTGGEARRVTGSTMAIKDAAYTPDGERIVFRSNGEGRDIVCRTTVLYSLPADGPGEPVPLTDPVTDDVANQIPTGPTPLACEPGAVTTIRVWRGAVQLVRFDIETGKRTPFIEGERQVTSFGHGGGVFAATVATDTSAGEVVIVDATGDERVLTDYTGMLAPEVALFPMREIETDADDGYPVHGWVVKPGGQGPFPVLFNIHGGPFGHYGWKLFDEAQVYAGAGYAVVMGNPRGSQGYGLEHARAVVGRIGDRDEADLLALLDAALADPDLDGGRVGLMGGSYGGLMTTLLAGREDRFAAAISERALNSFDSFVGSSDIGAVFPDLIAGPDAERQRAQSPLTYADGITCPMLIIHSEEDWRCPLEQAQQLFVRLRKRGVPAEMLVFPGEGHELSRSGLPSHRVARFEAILEWWERHLR
jgi:dipeptidyl aminopeptidase/acylaminoacyl peptidase